MTSEQKIKFFIASVEQLKKTIIKLTAPPLTDEELYQIAEMEGDFEDNYKLVIEARNNHFLLK